MSPRRGRLALLAVAIALALAGCAVAAPTAGDAAGDGLRQVALENSSLDLEADRIFAEVERLVGENVSGRPSVYVLRGETVGNDSFAYPYTPYGFVQDLALTEVAPGGDDAAGVTDNFGRVYLIPGQQSRHERRTVLVHEYVHVIQTRRGLLPWRRSSLGGDIPTDLAQTRLGLIEGPAVWVTDAYVRRHLPANVTNQSTRMRLAYERARVGGRYFLARYHFGYLGVDRRIDSPDALRGLYAPPVPNTTEQLIHGYGPAEEPPRRFDVDAGGGGDWTGADPTDEDVMGELFVRVALSRNLSIEAAADAADGWGYDRLVEYERNGTDGYVWITRWDDPENATVFEGAFETYVDRRSTGPEESFRVERLSETFVVVYSGPPAFTQSATTARTADGVRVSVGG